MAHRFISPQHKPQKPDDETVRQKNEETHQTRAVPNMPDFQRNESGGCTNHQPFSPSFLQIHPDAFREQDGAVKERQKGGRAQGATGEYFLEAVQEKPDRFAVRSEEHTSELQSPYGI